MHGGRGFRHLLALGAVAACALPAAACGGGDEDEIRATVEGLQRDLAARDVGGMCDAMSERPKQQIGRVGHGNEATTCERDLRNFLRGMTEQAELLGERPPNLRRLARPAFVAATVDGDRATAHLRLRRKPLDVPLVKQDGKWKLDELFVVTGPVPRYLD